jgi:glycosyltransferase involved in cell wall biosynthesis
MKILFLTRYDEQGASSRYRVYQYLDYFRDRGHDVSVLPLLNKTYLENRYRKPKAFSAGQTIGILLSFLRRAIVVAQSQSYDVVFVQYEMFPYLPAFLELLISRFACRLIYDYDDAMHIQYRESKSILSSLVRDKIPRLMRNADGVVVGNSYLSTFAKQFQPDVFIVPSGVALNRYSAKIHSEKPPHEPVVIGWIGTPVTSRYLGLIREALQRLATTHTIRLQVVGDPAFRMEGIEVRALPWNYESEADDVLAFDVGVMPLEDTNWEKGKCGVKLLQYMASGLPSVASPIGINNDIVQQGETGFLARTTEEWYETLKLLVESSALRRRVGHKARQLVAQKYDTRVVAQDLITSVEKIGCS